MEFKYSVILLCLAFATFLTVKEIKRGDKSRLIARVLASMVMVACFALLIIPIYYTAKKEEAVGEINFFTEKANPFVDLHYHLKSHPEIKKINIYGYGLSAEELEKFQDYQLSFHPSALPSGFISATWPKKIKATGQLMVQGIYQNSTNSPVKIKLYGLGITLDSATVKANTKLNFSFTSNPKQMGKAIFSLIAMQNKDTLSAEPVPFEVEPKEFIRVLILASFPDFEYKFLKRWLFENQFQVAFRSQISKNKYNTEFLNRKPVNLIQINQALLKDIDVAIIDEEEIKPELLSAVNSGMGLIVRKKAIKSAQDHQPLLTDTAGKISADRRLNGLGKIVTTNVAKTYQLQLAGRRKEYGEFWSLLFVKALRKKLKDHAYSIAPQWPTVNEKTRLIVNVSSAKPPALMVDNARLAPRQNIELPFEWDGVFWPKTVGWATVSVDQKTDDIYNYGEKDWATAKKSEKLNATIDFIANQKEKELNRMQNKFLVKRELSKWWFFIGFLASISFLWYEQRFLMDK